MSTNPVWSMSPGIYSPGLTLSVGRIFIGIQPPARIEAGIPFVVADQAGLPQPAYVVRSETPRSDDDVSTTVAHDEQVIR